MSFVYFPLALAASLLKEMPALYHASSSHCPKTAEGFRRPSVTIAGAELVALDPQRHLSRCHVPVPNGGNRRSYQHCKHEGSVVAMVWHGEQWVTFSKDSMRDRRLRVKVPS